MYLDKVYIRHREGYPDSPNTYAAWDGFQQLGVETVPYYGFGDVEAITDFGPTVGISGFIGDVHAALRTLGWPVPDSIDYPEELRAWLGREIWRATLGDIRRKVDPLFIKPVEHKLFSGFVWRGVGGESIRITTCADDVEVWVSEPVKFESEYRVFVKDARVLGARLYKGDWGKAIDRSVVERAVGAFSEAPRGYSLDFGVSDRGETLLVEANDGYALGHYGLPSPLYAQLIEARWEELTR